MSYASETEEEHWAYNITDCVITREVGEVGLENVAKLGLSDVHEFQQKLFWPVLRSMVRGVRIDQDERNSFALLLADEIAKRDQYFIDILGHPLNPNSNPQMTTLFYDDLGQQPIMSRATKTSPSHLTCDDEALVKIKAREPILRPLIRAIQERRSLGVFLSTFVRAPLDKDGRMRTSFNTCGAVSYRFSSSKNAFGGGTNLENIPKGGDDDDSDLVLPNVRTLFIPDPGNTFFDIDLPSADLQTVVWESNEIEMKQLLRAGLDPYTEIAKEFYNDKSIDKQDPRRQKFKSFAHGTHYLGTPRGLAQRLGLSVTESERTQAWYFKRFPRIKTWQENLKVSITKKHEVRNRFGYVRHFFGRIGDEAFREGAAWIGQSTTACLINRIYLKLYENLPECEVLLQVHDSLAGQFPTARAAWFIQRIKEESLIPIPYDDPLVLKIGVKTSEKSWGHCG